MQSVRIVEIPECRAVSSGTGMFGQEKFDRFSGWLSGLPRTAYPMDYLFWDGAGFCWLYVWDGHTEVPEGFEVVDFTGGLYAVATDIDGRTDVEAMDREVDDFLAQNGFVRDGSRFKLGNVITSPSANAVLKYNQMNYYSPIRPAAPDGQGSGR